MNLDHAKHGGPVCRRGDLYQPCRTNTKTSHHPIEVGMGHIRDMRTTASTKGQRQTYRGTSLTMSRAPILRHRQGFFNASTWKRRQEYQIPLLGRTKSAATLLAAESGILRQTGMHLSEAAVTWLLFQVESWSWVKRMRRASGWLRYYRQVSAAC